MKPWSKTPPTYKEWRDADNHGCWWVKFILSSEFAEEMPDGSIYTWPEAWYTEVVTISMSCENLDHISQAARGEMPDYSGIRLHAKGQLLRSLDLDDEEKCKDMYWQKVIAPLDDVRDRRPNS